MSSPLQCSELISLVVIRASLSARLTRCVSRPGLGLGYLLLNAKDRSELNIGTMQKDKIQIMMFLGFVVLGKYFLMGHMGKIELSIGLEMMGRCLLEFVGVKGEL